MSSTAGREPLATEQFRDWGAAVDPAAATRHWAALASIVAAVIHLGVIPAQTQPGTALVSVVIAVGCFQLVFAGLVWRRSTASLALTGIVVNLAVALVHVATRATGPPTVTPALSLAGGSHVDHRGERADGWMTADLVATGAGLAVVWLLVLLLPPPVRRRTVDALLLAGVGVWLLRLILALG